ncbi:MAG: hypothetical protein KDA92_27405, partial [Planctomycetales bacterium]|nr:hypothetical protein [Planctomycetales bacterium]
MDRFDLSTLERLASDPASPCVSLYMPTHRAGAEGEQDSIRLKNLANQAADALDERWLREPTARRLVDEIIGLAEDRSFWKHRSDGLAVFSSLGIFEPYRVPIAFAPSVSVA